MSDLSIFQQEIINDILSKTGKLTNTSLMLKNIGTKNFDTYVKDINELINIFNTTTPNEIAINAIHLKAKLKEPLPLYENLLDLLKNNSKLQDLVINEFNTSKYLNEVWNIQNHNRLYISLLILIYRTTMLNYYPYLKESDVQISSALEETAALAVINGNVNKVFDAAKIWLENWKDEGFSKDLYDLLKQKHLL